MDLAKIMTRQEASTVELNSGRAGVASSRISVLEQVRFSDHKRSAVPLIPPQPRSSAIERLALAPHLLHVAGLDRP